MTKKHGTRPNQSDDALDRALADDVEDTDDANDENQDDTRSVTGTDDEHDSDGDDRGDGGDWTPPTREEYEATLGKLRRARVQAKKLRERQQGKSDAEDESDNGAAASEELEKWQVRAVRSDARAGLLERGADPDLVELALARLRPGDVDFDDDDDPVLDEWLDEMEERYPRLFRASTPASSGTRNGRTATTTTKPPRVKVDQGSGGRPASHQPTLRDQIKASMHGGRSRRR